MSRWSDSLLPASWRGIPFKVEGGYRQSGGRRIQNHEYPGREDNWTEDIGKATREIPMTGFVVESHMGPPFKVLVKSLLDACEKPGPGILMHPTRGMMTVVLTRYDYVEQFGKATINFTFLPAGVRIFPVAVEIPSVDVGLAGEAAMAAALVAMKAAYTVAGPPSIKRGAVDKAVTMADTISATVALAYPDDEAAAIQAGMTDLDGNVRDLADDGEDLGTAYQTALDNIASPGLILSNELSAIWLNDIDIEAKTWVWTDNQQTAKTNDSAQDQLVYVTALAKATTAAVSATYPSYQEAMVASKEYADAITTAEENADHPDVIDTCRDLRIKFVDAIRVMATDLPDLVNHDLSQTMPAITLANDLYGDAEREDEIVERNAIAHPGFIYSLEPVKVLAE